MKIMSIEFADAEHNTSMGLINLRRNYDIDTKFVRSQNRNMKMPNRFKIDVDILGCRMQPYSYSFDITVDKNCPLTSIDQ